MPSIAKPGLTLEIHLKIFSFVAVVFCLAQGLKVQADIAPAPDILAKMSIEEKVGQLMIWSFHGTEFNPQMKTVLRSYQPGALIAFRRNITTMDEIGRLNNDAQNFAKAHLKAPLFLMIDQEGGMVSRLRMNASMPSALALGRTGDPALIANFAKTKAELLRALGFNVNLAPVLDISNPSKDSFIGNRTFGDDPSLVSEMGMAYARGLSEGGVFPTAKHFPGHGGTLQDSHFMTPKKLSSPEELNRTDLVPFKKFGSTDFPRLVMMAHLSLPSLDPSGVPATYSKILIQEHLRSHLAYGGLVVTDDLEMNGAMISPDIGERAVRAILAGNDMIMLAGSFSHQKRAFRSVLSAVKAGRISEDRLNDSVLRILIAKAHLSPSAAGPDRQKVSDAVKKLKAQAREIMRMNFKFALEGRGGDWPPVTPRTRVLVVGSNYAFFKSFQTKFAGRTRFFHLTPETLANAEIIMGKERADFIVFYATGATTARWISRKPTEMRARTIVVNCNHPGEIADQHKFLDVLNLNSHSPDSGGWLAAALSADQGQRMPAKELPSTRAIESEERP
jgi:beta-N-acetylhexosaminidase